MKGERLGGKPSYLLEGCFKSMLVCLGKEDCISLIKLTLSAGLEKKIAQCPCERFLGFCKEEFDFNMPKPSRLEGVSLDMIRT